jgi:hypothetical protein
MTPEARLTAVENNLKALLGSDIYVTRSYSDLDTKMDTYPRMYAIVSSGFPQFGKLFDTEDEIHNFMIVAQEQVTETTAGSEKEAIEFAMIENIRSLVANDGQQNDPLNIEIISARQSRQMDPLYAWVLCELRFNDL